MEEVREPQRFSKLGGMILVLINDFKGQITVDGEVVDRIKFNSYYHEKTPRVMLVVKGIDGSSYKYSCNIVKSGHSDAVYIKLSESMITTLDPLFMLGLKEDLIDINITESNDPIIEKTNINIPGYECIADVTECIKEVTVENKLHDDKPKKDSLFTIHMEENEVWNVGVNTDYIPLITRKTFESNKFLLEGRDIRNVVKLAEGFSCGHMYLEHEKGALLGKVIHEDTNCGSEKDNKLLKQHILNKDDIKISYEKLIVPMGDKNKVAKYLFGIIE